MQVVKLLPHVMRRPAFDETRDISWQRVRVGRKEQMDMVGLNGQSLNVPMLLLCHFFDDLLQTICNWPDQNLPPSLGAENDVVQDMVDRMLLMNYVSSLSVIIVRAPYAINIFPYSPSPKQGTIFYPPLERRGLSNPTPVTSA